MKLSILLKSVYSNALFYSGLTSKKIEKMNKPGSFLILMYHRVTYPDETMQPGMFVTPATFDKHLQFLSEKFTVLSLKDLLAIVKKDTECSFEKPVCVITFDDGWKDFYDNAFPLLCKYNLPATVFLPTGYIGTGNRFWTDIYADLLLRRQKKSADDGINIKYSEIISQLNSFAGDYEEKLEQGLALLKTLPRVQLLELLDELSKIWDVSSVSDNRDFINWSEVQEMADTELISFGSHTVTHEILTTIPEDEVRSELVNSKNELLEKGIMDSQCQSFCYPNGGCTSRLAELVRDSGYHIAVTTRGGWNNSDESLVALNRVGIHQDMTSTVPLFASRTAGFI